MQFLMNIKAPKGPSGPPSPRLIAAMDQFIAEMTKAGAIVATGGLSSEVASTRITAAGGRLTCVDGPYPETKELIAGFAIVEAASKEQAVEWGMRFMRLHQEVLGDSWEGESEIHRVFGPDEGPPAKS